MSEPLKPRIYRSFSSSNLHATNRIHDYVTEQERNQDNSHRLTREVTKSSMIIPTFLKMGEIHAGLPKYFINLITNCQVLKLLERDRLVNWCNAARSMVPLNTDADGNCLLHSISLYIFGVHDRKLNLRRFVHRYLVAENRYHGKLYIRWKNEQEKILNEVQTVNSTEIRRDWDTVIQAASPHEFPNGNQGLKYSSLEDIHIFTACIILARPIIVICDRVLRSANGVALQANRIGGIYLPILRDPSECEKTPIVLVFHQNHFMPFLNGEDHNLLMTSNPDHPDAQLCVPLMYHDLDLLPVRFTLPSDPADLLHRYLDCINLPYFSGERRQEQSVLAAMLKFKPPPAWSVELMWSLFSRAQEQFLTEVTVPQTEIRGSQWYDESQRPARPLPALATTSPPETSSARRSPSSAGSGNFPLLSSTKTSQFQQLPSSLTAIERSPRPCKRVSFGCKNAADYPTDLCLQCRRNVDASSAVSAINGASGLETSQGNIGPPSRKSSVLQCPHCQNPGLEQLRGLCKTCYNQKFILGPIDTPIPASGAAAKPEPHVSRPQIEPHIKAAKAFCADPGCQEPPMSGSRRCRLHIENLVECMTEGCRNTTTDKELPLCDKCRKEQCDAEAAVTRKERSRNEQQRAQLYPSEGPQDTYLTREEMQEGIYRFKEQQEAYISMKDPSVTEEERSLLRRFGGPQEVTITRKQPSRSEQERMYQYEGNQELGLSRKQPSRDERERAQMYNFEGPQVYPTFDQPRHPSRVSESSEDAYDVPRWQQAYQRAGVPKATSNGEGGFEHLSNAGRQTEMLSKLSLNSEKQGLRERNSPQPSLSRQERPSFEEHIYDQILPQKSGSTVPPSVENYDIFQRAQMYKNINNVSTVPPIPPRDTPTSTKAYVNQGYEPGNYSMVSGFETKCIVDRCDRKGKEKNGGLCQLCYEQSLVQEELIRNEVEKKRQAALASRVQKLPADSPYLNPVPCKTVGCPRTGIRAYADLCAVCSNKSLERNLRMQLGSEPTHQEPDREQSFRPPVASQAHLYDPPVVAHQDTVMRPRGMNCSTPGCTFFASPEYGSLCSKCFLEKTKADAGRANHNGDFQRPLEANIYTYARGSQPPSDEIGRAQPHIEFNRSQPQSEFSRSQPHSEFSRSQPHSAVGSPMHSLNQPCRNSGCNMFGRPEQDGFCSKCYR